MFCNVTLISPDKSTDSGLWLKGGDFQILSYVFILEILFYPLFRMDKTSCMRVLLSKSGCCIDEWMFCAYLSIKTGSNKIQSAGRVPSRVLHLPKAASVREPEWP